MNTAGTEQLPPLSLYVHLPWCVRKCPYCDFNSHRAPQDLDQDRYLDALLMDLAEQVRGETRALQSVFFGGGTPSLFRASTFERFLQALGDHLEMIENPEITLEANPGTVEHGDFSGYRQAGINRLSLGVQSYHPASLTALGRIHSDQEARNAAQAARDAGFERINLDLMFALPGQSLELAVTDIKTALAFDPGHISHYQLTLEPNTAFAANPPPLPDDDAAYAIQVACSELMTAAGYVQYEVSAWSRPGQQGRHNLNYWTFGDYLAIGAGAHGKLSRPRRKHRSSSTGGPGEVVRFARERHPAAYLADPTAYQERRTLGRDDLIFEYFLNALRLRQPVLWADFEARTRLCRTLPQTVVARLAEKELVEILDAGFSVTALGQRFLNDVMGAFLPDQASPDSAPKGQPKGFSSA